MDRAASVCARGRWRVRQPGQALLEFSLVSMIFVGLLVGIIEGARMIGTYFALSNAAAEAARMGAIVPSSTATGNIADCNTLNATQASNLSVASLDNKIRCRARETMQPWVSLPDSAITICRRATITSSCDASGTSTVVSNSYYGGSVIDVTVNYNFEFVPFEGGFLQATSIPMTGYKRARID